MTRRKTGFWAASATAMWKRVSIATHAVVSVSRSMRSSRWARRSRSSGPRRRAAYPATGISMWRRTSSRSLAA